MDVRSDKVTPLTKEELKAEQAQARARAERRRIVEEQAIQQRRAHGRKFKHFTVGVNRVRGDYVPPDIDE